MTYNVQLGPTEAAVILMEKERDYVGWHVATTERVNAWRNESPGNLNLHFRLQEFDPVFLDLTDWEPRSDGQYEEWFRAEMIRYLTRVYQW